METEFTHQPRRPVRNRIRSMKPENARDTRFGSEAWIDPDRKVLGEGGVV